MYCIMFDFEFWYLVNSTEIAHPRAICPDGGTVGTQLKPSKATCSFNIHFCSLPETWVLQQAGGHHLLVLLGMDWAGGVHHTLQTGEAQGMVETVQLERCQGLQTTLVLLLLGGWGLVPQTHHPWERNTHIILNQQWHWEYKEGTCFRGHTDTLTWVLLGHWGTSFWSNKQASKHIYFVLRIPGRPVVLLPDPLHDGSSRMYSTSLYCGPSGSTFRKSWLASCWHVTPARSRRVDMVERRLASRSKANSLLQHGPEKIGLGQR